MTRRKPINTKNIKENIPNVEIERKNEFRNIMTIFREIHDSYSHERLLTQLKIEFYDKLNIEEFSDDFFECFRCILIYQDRLKTEIPLLFCVRFVVMVLSNNDREQLIKSVILTERLIGILTGRAGHSDPMVRFHCCQATKLLLAELNDTLPVSDNLFESLQAMLLDRFSDVKAYIRAEAVSGSSRLQSPTDTKCPVISALIHSCKFDSVNTVRLAALQSLAITSTTLPCVVERTRDVSDLVRKAAFGILVKWKILTPLSISTRLSLVECGLTDKSSGGLVMPACKELLAVWLQASNDNMVALLKRLDAENNERVTEMAFAALLSSMTTLEVESIVKQALDLMNDERLITVDKLNAESAFFWRNLIVFINERSKEYAGVLDKLLPEVCNFEKYLRGLFQISIDHHLKGEIALDKYAEYCTIIKNLLPIVNYIDIFDIYNRNMIIDLIKWAMSSVDIHFVFVEPLMKLFVNLEIDNIKICNQTVAIINDLLFFDKETAAIDNKENQENCEEVDRSEINKEIIRKLRIEIAEVEVKINELKEELRVGLDGNCEGLSEIIGQLKCLENRKRELIEEKNSSVKLSSAEEEEVREEVMVVVEEEVQLPWMTTGEGMEGRIMKANMLTTAMIGECHLLWTMPPSLRSLFTGVVVVSVQHPNVHVREKAVLALGLCCLLDKQLAVNYRLLFFKALEVDHQQVMEVALKCLVDLFIRFGLEPFLDSVDSAEEAADHTDHNSSKRNNVTDLVNPIMSLLTHESRQLSSTAAVGLSKLLYHHKISSPKLLSRLLVMWFSPQQLDDSNELKSHLDGFFTNFSLMSTANQKAISDSFVITLNSLFAAPASSPLSQIDITNVVDFFLRLTDSKYLLENRVSKTTGADNILPVKDVMANLTNPCHDELGIIISNEILKAPIAAEVKYYVLTLVRLRFSPDNFEVITDIAAKLQTMLKKLKDKRSLQLLKKLSTELQLKLGITIDNVNDTENQINEEITILKEDLNLPIKTPRKMKKVDDNLFKKPKMVDEKVTLPEQEDQKPVACPKRTPKKTKNEVKEDAFKKPVDVKRITRSSTRVLPKISYNEDKNVDL